MRRRGTPSRIGSGRSTAGADRSSGEEAMREKTFFFFLFGRWEKWTNQTTRVGRDGREGSAPIAAGKAAPVARRWSWPWPPARSSRVGWRKKKSQGHFHPEWHFCEDTLVKDGILAKPI